VLVVWSGTPLRQPPGVRSTLSQPSGERLPLPESGAPGRTFASDPAHLSRNENGDTLLNTWIVAWVIHQAPRAPLQLFNANIFYPEPNTLAYSEALLVQSAMGAPLVWAGASPVLTYNILLIAGFALTGWAACLVLVRWTGDWWAGLAGGLVFGFNAHTLTRMPHLQALHVEFLPFALLAFDRLLVDPRARHAVSFAVWFVLQALASFYLLVITSVGFAVAIAVRPEAWTGKIVKSLVMQRGSFESYSTLVRFYAWQTALNMFLHFPWLGVGYDSFRFFSREFNALTLNLGAAENFVFETAAGLGIGGVAIVVWMARALRRLGKSVQGAMPEGTRAYALAKLSGPFLVAVAVANMTGDNLIGMMGVAQLAVFSALLVTAARIETPPLAEPRTWMPATE